MGHGIVSSACKYSVVVCLLFSSLAYGQLALLQAAKAPQHPLLRSHEDNKTSLYINNDFVVSKVFNFDINRNYYGDHLTINENVSPLVFSGGITGGVKFARGDFDQKHSFIILVQVSSSIEAALDFVSISNDTYTLFVSSTGSSLPTEDLLIAIDIIVFVKSHVLQFGHTNIQTANLDIDIYQDVDFETYHMTLSAGQGSITGIESLYFTAHEISISTEYGSILGNWSLPASISFTADNGDIDIDLIPKRWSSGPGTGGDLAALAKAGDITIRMPFETDKLSLRNGTSIIEAYKGSIAGTFVHGAITSLKAHNSIDATLLPFWAFYEWAGIQHNFITTNSLHGNTTIEILPPVIDSYYKINPLFFAISRHTQGSWTPPLSPVLRMNITYPGDWGGIAVGYSGFGGTVSVSGEDFEELEKNSSTVKVQRRPVGSDLWFETDMGIAELHLNPCSVLTCGFS